MLHPGRARSRGGARIGSRPPGGAGASRQPGRHRRGADARGGPIFDELRLVRLGLANYWGYNPYTFMAAEPRFAVSGALGLVPGPWSRRCTKRASRSSSTRPLNHTAEDGPCYGPTRRCAAWTTPPTTDSTPSDQSRYLDWTWLRQLPEPGASARAPAGAWTALRHWAALGRRRFPVRPSYHHSDATGVASFLSDAPLLPGPGARSRCGPVSRSIAEPWDLGPGRLSPRGSSPPPSAMWNDRYRDCCAPFLAGDEAVLPELAGRPPGSADLYEAAAGHRSSVNTDHQPRRFHAGRPGQPTPTRHNEANGEQNRDGHHDNLSANHSVEGATDDPSIRVARARQRRNLLATLLLGPRHADDPHGRRDGGARRRATTTPTARTTRLSWLAWPEAADQDFTLNHFLRAADRAASCRRCAKPGSCMANGATRRACRRHLARGRRPHHGAPGLAGPGAAQPRPDACG